MVPFQNVFFTNYNNIPYYPQDAIGFDKAIPKKREAEPNNKPHHSMGLVFGRDAGARLRRWRSVSSACASRWF
jgi:hypothetical protein